MEFPRLAASEEVTMATSLAFEAKYAASSTGTVTADRLSVTSFGAGQKQREN
jgi:hypothetical protein